EVTSITDMVFQSPGGFEATQKGYFYQRARPVDIQLARRVIQGERFHPATYSLWFSCPKEAVPLNGLASGIQVDIKRTAFIHRCKRNARESFNAVRTEQFVNLPKQHAHIGVD